MAFRVRVDASALRAVRLSEAGLRIARSGCAPQLRPAVTQSTVFHVSARGRVLCIRAAPLAFFSVRVVPGALPMGSAGCPDLCTLRVAFLRGAPSCGPPVPRLPSERSAATTPRAHLRTEAVVGLLACLLAAWLTGRWMRPVLPGWVAAECCLHAH